jgi:Putative peptidoglycan binding domain
MPRTLTYGSQGPDVVQLQGKLNVKLPAVKPPLATDGIFGPKTLARVKMFQQQNTLVPDGIVGPLTWAALDRTKPGPVAVCYDACGCATAASRGAHNAIFASHAKNFRASESFTASAFSARSATSLASAAPASSEGFDIRRVTDAEKAKLEPFYGNSISYFNVFMTNKTGIDNRAFVLTIAPPGLPNMMATQYVNIGTNYTDHTLIHEFGHVWEAQHHMTSPTAYMVNALVSQGAAEAMNKIQGVTTWSAYAYANNPVRSIVLCGAEQIAQMVANGEASAIREVRAVGLFQGVPMLLSPSTPFIENHGAPGVR